MVGREICSVSLKVRVMGLDERVCLECLEDEVEGRRRFNPVDGDDDDEWFFVAVEASAAVSLSLSPSGSNMYFRPLYSITGSPASITLLGIEEGRRESGVDAGATISQSSFPERF